MRNGRGKGGGRGGGGLKSGFAGGEKAMASFPGETHFVFGFE